jgi:diaminopimelate epimerase
MITFAKAHGYGNDFLYVEREAVEGADHPALAREMCERYRGIGADGLIVYARTEGGASMRLFNADGSRAEVSGNGIRGLGALLAGEMPRVDVEIAIETEAGTKRLARTGVEGTRQTFCASMGLPSDLARETLVVDGEAIDLVTLDMGNPQAVLLGPLPAADRFDRLGPAIERHPRFPHRTNVEFVQVESPTRIRIRIWERGVGPSHSSGSGSCASLVAAAAFGGAERDAEVIAPGGSQRVAWRADSVYLTGWAEVLCRGEWLRPLPR